jgi:hypothetical protein
VKQIVELVQPAKYQRCYSWAGEVFEDICFAFGSAASSKFWGCAGYLDHPFKDPGFSAE